jgi:hypothetical protein
VGIGIVPGTGVKRREGRRGAGRDREEERRGGVRDTDSEQGVGAGMPRTPNRRNAGPPRTPNRRVPPSPGNRRVPPSPTVGIKRIERDQIDREAGRNAGRRAYPAAGPPPSGDMGMSINAAPWREDRGRLGSPRRNNRGGPPPALAVHHEVGVAQREREDQLANIRQRYFQERKEARERMSQGATPQESRGNPQGAMPPSRNNNYGEASSKQSASPRAAANPFPVHARPGRRRPAGGAPPYGGQVGGRDAIDNILSHDIGGGPGRVGPQHGRRRNY